MNFNTMERNRGAEHLPQALGDDALVLAAQTGDEGAFTELWIRHSEMVLRVLMRVTKNREDAEDAMQEAFLKAFAHLGTFESRAKFSTWLIRIAVNSGLMILRRQRSRPTISIDSQFDGENWKQWDVEDRTLDIESSYMRAERAGFIAVCDEPPWAKPLGCHSASAIEWLFGGRNGRTPRSDRRSDQVQVGSRKKCTS